ncbi:MAG: Transcriptional regulator, MarR family [uncultured Solirubrobacteraceae bacterium]|uniref:Transcriptional regulator, MarR family n=1 Tax=uncultured Solirubrobacteraceae bacterium TaxID=1162706 RepID=A0A6J4TSS6_9ACTN|nr:MAG: Transcriptional regulator, MarR family [uncultured Solirubrobacteraceae bacterium]
MTEMTAALEDLGLSPRARCVLMTALEGEFTQIEIARMIGVDKTTMVVTLDELERVGLAERRPSSKDRRARVIAVTAKGKAMVRKGGEVVKRVQDEVLETLPAKERAALVDGLQRLVSERLAEPAQCASPVRRRRAA